MIAKRQLPWNGMGNNTRNHNCLPPRGRWQSPGMFPLTSASTTRANYDPALTDGALYNPTHLGVFFIAESTATIFCERPMNKAA